MHIKDYLMPQMIITITNIFNNPDKFVTVKMINLIIEISTFAPKDIKVFMQ